MPLLYDSTNELQVIQAKSMFFFETMGRIRERSTWPFLMPPSFQICMRLVQYHAHTDFDGDGKSMQLGGEAWLSMPQYAQVTKGDCKRQQKLHRWSDFIQNRQCLLKTRLSLSRPILRKLNRSLLSIRSAKSRQKL